MQELSVSLSCPLPTCTGASWGCHSREGPGLGQGHKLPSNSLTLLGAHYPAPAQGNQLVAPHLSGNQVPRVPPNCLEFLAGCWGRPPLSIFMPVITACPLKAAEPPTQPIH